MLANICFLKSLLYLVILLSKQESVKAQMHGVPPVPGQQDELKCVSGFCLPREYKKLETPKEGKNFVNIETQIMDILEVNDKEFSVTLTMYFNVQWDEPRIETNNTFSKGEMVPIDMMFLNHLWIPNIFIYDLRKFAPLSVLKKLAGVWIVEGKSIYYSQATTIKFSCAMRFDRYPLDEHFCKFRIGSTNLDISRMEFGEVSYSYDPSARNTILDYAVEIKLLPEEFRILSWEGLGNYSITGIEIIFTRHKLKYMYMYYLPSGLFVVVSWVSFLVPPEVVPGRMAMLITLFLVLINIFNTVTSASPNTEGMNAITAWMLVCIFFVFGALGGYAFLLWRKKKSCLKRHRLRKMSDEEAKARVKKKEDHRSRVDDFFLVAFPCMFLIFNLIYWPTCLSKPEADSP